MLKGHATIELKNVHTGEIERYEDDNLITNAINYIIDMEMARNHPPNDYCLSVCSKLLGGLMMFDGALDESADNIHFPTDVHLVGFAGQSTNTTHPMGGTFNTVESGRTENGYRSVWDFGTGQANGTIAALARTSAYGGENPIRRMHGPRFDTYYKGEPDTDKSWTPIRYDGEYMYMLKYNSSTHLMRLARVKMPIHGMRVIEPYNYPYEVIASWDATLRPSTTVQGKQMDALYASDTNFYLDGGDGYLYAFVGEWEDIYSATTRLWYFTIKYSDDSYDKSTPTYIDLPVKFYSNRGSCWYSSLGIYAYYRYFGRNIFHIINGNIYAMSEDRKQIYIVPLANPAAARATRIVQADNSDYINWLLRIPPHNGGTYFRLYHYLTNGTQYQNGILYPDGTYILPDVAGGEDDFYWDYWQHNGDKLEQIGNPYSDGNYARIGWCPNYIGTINNLSTPITKTAAQTMRIIYTLTDVDE